MASLFMKMACMVVAYMVMLAPHAEAAINCGQVASSMLPCLNYLRLGGQVPANCCSGVKSLNSAAGTPADRRTACGCLKSAYQAFPGIQAPNAASLPSRCGVNIPYKISPDVDCAKVH